MLNNFRVFDELFFFDLWIPDSGFWIPLSAFRFPDSGFRLRTPDSGFRLLGLPNTNYELHVTLVRAENW